MKVASRLFIGAGAFFLALFLIYWFTSYEPVGSTLLAIGTPSCLLIGVYLHRLTGRGGTLPEDRDGNHGDALGEVVSVPAPSLWPVGVAFGAGTFAAGLVLGFWLALPGAIVLLISIVALTLNGRNYS
jgi:hypothetical protein